MGQPTRITPATLDEAPEVALARLTMTLRKKLARAEFLHEYWIGLSVNEAKLACAAIEELLPDLALPGEE